MADALTTALESPTPYQRRIAEGLDRAWADPATEELELDLRTARLVVFSDHHKGARDGADDFWRCERAYRAALGHYLESGHRLLALGDVEELWENAPDTVLAAHRATLALEAELHRAGRYERFWGNHDDEWRSPRKVARRLHPLFPGLRVREALRLRVSDGGRPLGVLFLAHGHQGTLESDRFSWLSRLAVRHVWRPLQRRLNMASTTPSRDHELREEHDAAMFAWARRHPARPVLIAGHTHRPVFGRSRPAPPAGRAPGEVASELEAARAEGTAGAARRAGLRAELELLSAPPFGRPPQPVSPPCYFNTGCCSFGDGDVTGLEIADGEIRLVRWLDDEGAPRAKVLVSDALADVLAAVAGAGSPAARKPV